MTSPSSFGHAGSGVTVIATLTNGSVWTRTLRNKVPEVTLSFWMVLVLSATVVETASEYLSGDLGLGLSATTAIMSLYFAGAFMWQLSTGGYVPGVYWPTVLLASAVGATLSEKLVADLGLRPGGATALFCVALALIFLGWYGGERTVSIHTVFTRRREAWYWAAILCAFALGRSLDALLAQRLALGHATAVLVLGGVLSAVLVAHLGLKVSAAVTFWAAYVMAVPFGVSVGGWLSAASADGGLGLGTNPTSTIFLVALLAIVVWCAGVARRGSRGPRDAST